MSWAGQSKKAKSRREEKEVRGGGTWRCAAMQQVQSRPAVIIGFVKVCVPGVALCCAALRGGGGSMRDEIRLR